MSNHKHFNVKLSLDTPVQINGLQVNCKLGGPEIEPR
jgi:hypothetical protein